MTRRYSLPYAQDNLSEIVRQMEEGESVELTEEGEVVAVLVSCGDFKRYKRHTPNRPEAKRDLWAAIQRWRSEQDFESIDFDDVFDNVRDKSPGREKVRMGVAPQSQTRVINSEQLPPYACR